MTDITSADTRPRVHVVYEFGIDLRPHSSTYLRLIRPLTHPRVTSQINTTFNSDYSGNPVDIVIVDRFWRPGVTLQAVQGLIERIHQKKARYIYSLDDNFFDLILENKGWPTADLLTALVFMLKQADGVLVTTQALRERILEYNSNIIVLPNQLDERLLVIRHPSEIRPIADPDRIVIGYMGTLTHDEDLKLILPAIKSIDQRYPRRIEFQICGVISREEIKDELRGLPVRFVNPLPEENEYPLFMLWFTGHARWDIAISPLRLTPFNNCKSDIKFLDYAAIGTAGIFSQSPAYKSTVVHGENGWIADNNFESWEEALETLLSDISLRVKIAQNAIRYLYSERILVHQAHRWVDMVKLLCSSG